MLSLIFPVYFLAVFILIFYFSVFSAKLSQKTLLIISIIGVLIQFISSIYYYSQYCPTCNLDEKILTLGFLYNLFTAPLICFNYVVFYFLSNKGNSKKVLFTVLATFTIFIGLMMGPSLISSGASDIPADTVRFYINISILSVLLIVYPVYFIGQKIWLKNKLKRSN